MSTTDIPVSGHSRVESRAEKPRSLPVSDDFEELFESPLVGVALTAPDRRFLRVNKTLCRLTGYGQDELLEMRWDEITHADELDRSLELFDGVLEGRRNGYVLRKKYLRRDGNAFNAVVSSTPVRAADGSVDHFVSVVQDVSETTRMRSALAENEERLSGFYDVTHGFLWETGADLQITFLSRGVDQAVRMLPFDPIGSDPKQVVDAFLTDRELADGPRWNGFWTDLRARRPFEDYEFEWHSGDGITRIARANGYPQFADDGTFLGYRGTCTDVTEERLAMRKMEASNRRMLETFDNLGEAVALFDTDDRLVAFNRAYSEMFPVSEPTLLIPGARFEDLVRGCAARGLYSVDKQELDAFVTQRIRDHRNRPSQREHRLCDGRWVHVRENTTSDGGTLLIQFDVTQLKTTEAALQHAQKLETVGRFAGGVVHDFNNILSVIQGNLDLLRMNVGDDERNRDLVDQCIAAATRGAALTGSVLAFTRKRRAEPEPVNLVELLENMGRLIRSTVGDAVRAEFEIEMPSCVVRVDRNQLENAIMNLVVNARDAMPDGGRLMIGLEYGSPASLSVIPDQPASRKPVACLTVRDTGCGMTTEVLDSALEPFFTTKDAEKGSGLGLSMVQQFAVRSGGRVELFSEPNQGTTVRILFPVSFCRPAFTPETGNISAMDAATLKLSEAVPISGSAQRRVLVVDDSPSLRKLVVNVLESAGFGVTAAENGDDALECLQSRQFDLLVTDVVMPGTLNGCDLVRKARQLNAAMAILLTTGNVGDDAIFEMLETGDTPPLLRKPFRMRELLEQVRKVLTDDDAPD